MFNLASIRIRVAAVAAALCCSMVTASAQAQRPYDYVPPEMQGVGVVERLGEKVPLDLTFTDESGNTVQLADYFKAGKPVILTLNYYNCPQLCTLTLNGLVAGLKDVKWSAGEEFEIVTVSIDPEEGHELAEVKKRAYLTMYKRESVKDGWHFLVGEQENITKLANAVGFGYRYDAKSGEFAHTSTIIFLTPDGTISRYMNDVMFQSRDLRLALVEASQGTIGTAMEQFLLLTCFQWDPDSNSYAASAIQIVKLGGALTLIVLAAGLGALWWRGSYSAAGAADNSGSEDQAAAE